MKIVKIKYIPIYFFVSMLIYIFAIYFNATYYLPNGYVIWTEPLDWSKQLALLPHVSINEIQQILPIFNIILLGLLYIIMIFFSSFLNKYPLYSLIFLSLITLIIGFHGLIGLVSLLVVCFSTIDGEWLGEDWLIYHATGILLICVLLANYLYYKKYRDILN